MDPAAIIGTTGAIVGIVDLLTRSIKSLHELHDRWTKTNLTALNLISQLTALKAALSKIQEWVDSDLAREPQHYQLVLDLCTTLNCCQSLVNSVHERIESLCWQQTNAESQKGGTPYLRRSSSGESLRTKSKVQVFLKNRETRDFQRFIQQQVDALTLLLIACNSKSLSDQKSLLERSWSREAFNRVIDGSSSLMGLRRDSSSFDRQTPNSSSSIAMSRIFSFDTSLMGSQVYQKAVRRLFKKPHLPSANVRTTLEYVQTVIHPDRATSLNRTDMDGGPDTPRQVAGIATTINRDKRNKCRVLICGTLDDNTQYTWSQLETFANNYGELRLSSHGFIRPDGYELSSRPSTLGPYQLSSEPCFLYYHFLNVQEDPDLRQFDAMSGEKFNMILFVCDPYDGYVSSDKSDPSNDAWEKKTWSTLSKLSKIEKAVGASIITTLCTEFERSESVRLHGQQYINSCLDRIWESYLVARPIIARGGSYYSQNLHSAVLHRLHDFFIQIRDRPSLPEEDLEVGLSIPDENTTREIPSTKPEVAPSTE